MDLETLNTISINIYTDGFGHYALSHIPIGAYHVSEDSLNDLWIAYRAENEENFTDILQLPIELKYLNRSEKFFTDHPEIYPIFDYWKDKLLVDEYQNLLSPEKLISWEAFESANLDMFSEMMEEECGSSEAALDNYNPSKVDIKKDLDFMGAIMHVVSPFMLLMLRYAYYQTWLNKTIYDDAFRYNRATADYSVNDNKEGLHLNELHDINTNGVSAKRIYKSFAFLFSQAIKGYVETTPHAVDEKNIDVMTYIAMAQLEVTRLNQDETFLREHCQAYFVDSLIEWHRGYFAYIIQQIHSFKGYEKFQIPEYRVTEVQLKPHPVDENKALTDLGKKCRRAVREKIQECKTAADYGNLLYQLQYKLGYFTKDRLSRNDYYLAMQQIGKVTFGSSGDFSNSNKGFNQAREAAARQ
ncbi:MAG: hypothetical protein J6T80_05385 [Paludibacteraceae bacterium]|nr:hypothetical protein [Paludibacteraceae bacterium]